MPVNCSKFIYVLVNMLCIFILCAALTRPTQATENAPVFSYGSGPYELIVFSDYFCAPCQKMEKELDKIISGMIERGGVRVTFVDLPIYKLTPLYGTYFLYVLNAAPTYAEALRARRLLFEKASRIGAITDKHLETALQAANIPVKPYDIKQSLVRYKDMIRKYKIRSTPTFVFIYSSTDIRKYSKSEAIRKGMAELAKSIEERGNNSCKSCNSMDISR
jgi:protein-disulfide isomerase